MPFDISFQNVELSNFYVLDVCADSVHIANALKMLTFQCNSSIDEIFLIKGGGEGNQIKEAVAWGVLIWAFVILCSPSFQMIQQTIEPLLSNRGIKVVAVGQTFTCSKVPHLQQLEWNCCFTAGDILALKCNIGRTLLHCVCHLTGVVTPPEALSLCSRSQAGPLLSFRE